MGLLHSFIDEKTETVGFQGHWLRSLMKQRFKQNTNFQDFIVFIMLLCLLRIKKEEEEKNRKFRAVIACYRKFFGLLEPFNNGRTTSDIVSSWSLEALKLKLRDYI